MTRRSARVLLRGMCVSSVVLLLAGACGGTSGREGAKAGPGSEVEIDQAMQAISAKLAPEEPMLVAVLPLMERGFGPSLFGEYVADKLMAALAATHNVQLVERSKLDAVRGEQQLTTSGEIDDASAASIGNMAGAQAVAVGVLTRGGDRWEVSVRLLGSSDAKVVTIAEGAFPRAIVPAGLVSQAPKETSAPPASRRRSFKGQGIHDLARKPLSQALQGPSYATDQALNACDERNTGKCGCLPEDSQPVRENAGWGNGSTRYLIACCESVGSKVALYTCAQGETCDDTTGAAVRCVR